MTTTPTVYAVKLRTFGGDALEAIAMVDDGDSLTIVTDYQPGYWSAHAYGAHLHFEAGGVHMSHEHRYTDRRGRERVMTCWDRR